MVLTPSAVFKNVICAISVALLPLGSECLAQNDRGQDAVVQVIYTSTDPVLAEAITSFDSTGKTQFQFQWIDQSELKSRLLQQSENEDMPEIIVASEDLLGLHSGINLSPISPEQFNTYAGVNKPLIKSTLAEDGKLYGLPIAKGNQLVMYYHWGYVQTVAGSWHELLGQRYSIDESVELIGWSVLDMYWLIPFISAFGELPVHGNDIAFDVDGIAKSLRFVWGLVDKKVIDLNCNYECTVKKFLNGKMAYHINGVWEYEHFKKQLGDSLGVAPLPSINGKEMKPYYANIYLMFPGHALTGDHAVAINKFISYTQSVRFKQLLMNSMSSFSLYGERPSQHFNNETEDHKIIRYTLRNALPMPHHKKMFLVWEGMLKGFVRYGGGSIADYQAAGYMQHYVDTNN